MAPEDIFNRMEALHALTGLAVRALGKGGELICICGQECEYCRLFRQYLPEGESCDALHALAGRRALDLGEAYLFSCNAGVCHIAMPLMSAGEFEGSIMVGPFIIGECEPTILDEPARRYNIPLGRALELYGACSALSVLTPEHTGALCRVVRYIFSGWEGRGGALESNRRHSMQQSRIGETIQMYKGFANSAPAYPYEKERQLVSCVKDGDMAGANAMLNELLGYALFSTGGDIEGIKAHTVALCSLLSRAAIDGGTAAGDALNVNRDYMRRLWQAATIDDICYMMQDLVERFCSSAFPGHAAGGPSACFAIKRALNFIELNFAQDITLKSVAREVHLSESYFSTLFKKLCGASFTEYLNAVRVEESKRLLAQGELNVTEAASRVGFSSQSYFSKVFRRVTGMSPRRYAELHKDKRLQAAMPDRAPGRG